ncbi:hypothetical protein D3C77_626230 [compost metagenome]
MGADDHAFFGSGLNGAVNPGRGTCVKSAGDIGAGNDGKHRLVISHAPRAVTFAKITVEIDSGHVCLPLEHFQQKCVAVLRRENA